MATRPGKRRGAKAVKVVRKTLADGTVREYRYDRGALDRRRQEAAQANAIGQLMRAYFASPDFAALSPKWQKAQRHYCGILEDELGWMTFDDLQSRKALGEFYELRDRHAHHPHGADKLLNTARRLLNWAEGRALVDHNRARTVKRLVKSTASRAERVWTPAHEVAFLAAAPAGLAAVWRMALYTLLRKSDILALRWDQFDGQWLTIRPSKTSKTTAVVVHLPVFALPPLRDLVDGLPRASDFMFVTDGYAMPWSVENLGKVWRPTMKAAGLAEADLHFHDIRGTGITRMFAAGCTDAEVASVSGHAIGGGSELARYAARSRDLSVNAYRKWARALESPADVVPFATGNRRKTTG